MKYSYTIEQDQDAGNPRNEFDNLSTFYAVKNSRYITGGKNDVEYAYREDLEEAIKELRKEGAVIVEFDNSNVGTCYAVVERHQLKNEYLDFGYSVRKALYWARRCAKGEAKTFAAWANGEVYGYMVKDEDGNTLDSCWGFYGYNEAEQRAKDFIKWREEEDAKEDALILSRLAA